MISGIIEYQMVQEERPQVYDPEYAHVFEHIRNRISNKLPDVVIEHIGSTAVSGIKAKPIIDVLIPCKKELFSYILRNLAIIGFQSTPFKNIPEDRPMMVGAILYNNKLYNIHIHLTPEGSDIHLDNIYFREALRESPILAKEYEKYKDEAVEKQLMSADQYNKVKAPFIQAIIAKRKRGSL